MTTILFDVETSPLTAAEIEAQLPEFDESEVKVGNIKDPDKAAAKIAEAKAKHRQDFFDRAALSATTGKVVAIGYCTADDDSYHFDLSGEPDCLNTFWDNIRNQNSGIHRLIGFNIKLFDLPFLIRRSWKHGIPVPYPIRDGKWWSKEIIDLRDEWQLGDRTVRGSLDAISKFLGTGEKIGDGKDFARLLEEDREQAIAYLRHDLELTRLMAKRFGLI